MNGCPVSSVPGRTVFQGLLSSSAERRPAASLDLPSSQNRCSGCWTAVSTDLGTPDASYIPWIRCFRYATVRTRSNPGGASVERTTSPATDSKTRFFCRDRRRFRFGRLPTTGVVRSMPRQFPNEAALSRRISRPKPHYNVLSPLLPVPVALAPFSETYFRRRKKQRPDDPCP